MKEDPKFNKAFIALVKLHPCLYDKGNENYNHKPTQNKAWKTIGKKVSGTVDECKDRWRNLRACYSRHLKRVKESSGRKPYYLAARLNFLYPFTNVRNGKFSKFKNKNAIQQMNRNCKRENDTDALDVENVDIKPFKTKIKQQNNNQNATLNEEQNNTAAILTLNEDQVEISASSDQWEESEPNSAFLKSLLPDMLDMNNDQKRRFKIGMLQMAGEILREHQWSTQM